VLRHLYGLGIRPDWWKLEAQPTPDAWKNVADAVAAGDAYCRGIVLLGRDAPAEELRRAFDLAAAVPVVRGFAVGRTIFASPAERWLSGSMSDAEATTAMADAFASLVEAWQSSRRKAEQA
jgi:5-dehydro-2-deoxygluconokinase